jgi:putative transposase
MRTTASKPKTSPRKKRLKKGEQLCLAKTGGWGGKRANAGRKRSADRGRVSHAKRPVHKGRHPVHVTLRVKSGLPSFRQQRVHRLLAEVLRDQRRRHYNDDFRVVHFSIQTNHLHLIVEADTERAEIVAATRTTPLRSGVSGLKIAFARRLNMMLRRRGSVWDDRYHRHDLTTARETVRGLGYLFDNYTHHGEQSFGDGVLDLHSSAWLFEGWAGPHVVFDERERWLWPICRAETWLLQKGWQKHEPLTIVPRHG